MGSEAESRSFGCRNMLLFHELYGIEAPPTAGRVYERYRAICRYQADRSEWAIEGWIGAGAGQSSYQSDKGMSQENQEYRGIIVFFWLTIFYKIGPMRA